MASVYKIARKFNRRRNKRKTRQTDRTHFNERLRRILKRKFRERRSENRRFAPTRRLCHALRFDGRFPERTRPDLHRKIRCAKQYRRRRCHPRRRRRRTSNAHVYPSGKRRGMESRLSNLGGGRQIPVAAQPKRN